MSCVFAVLLHVPQSKNAVYAIPKSGNRVDGDDV